MKRLVMAICVLGLLVPFIIAQDKQADSKPEKPAAAKEDQAASKKAGGGQKPKTTAEKVSYGFGLNIGRNMKQQGLDINPDLLLKGIKDALAGADPLVTPEELEAAFTEFQKEMAAKVAAEQKVAADKNKKEGDAFLEGNKKKEGVKTLKSGLQYQVLKEGTGAVPKESDEVKTHYRGTLIDGTEFDSSYKRGEPAVFSVDGVIAGWTEALQLMKVGSKWKLFVPSELAYGERGAGSGAIGPNAVLIFEIELLGIEKDE